MLTSRRSFKRSSESRCLPRRSRSNLSRPARCASHAPLDHSSYQAATSDDSEPEPVIPVKKTKKESVGTHESHNAETQPKRKAQTHDSDSDVPAKPTKVMAKSTKVNSVVAPVRKSADADKTAGGAKARSKLDEDENDKPEPEKKKKRKLGLNKPAFHWDPILSVSAGRAKKRCWADGRVSMASFPRHCPRQDLLTGQGAWARGMLGSVQPRREVSADFSSPYCQSVCICTSPSAQLAGTGRGGERTVRPKVECRVL